MILSTIGDGDVFLFFVEFFLFVIWFWLLITIFGDLFRDHEMSGGMKAFWMLLRDHPPVPRDPGLPDRPGQRHGRTGGEGPAGGQGPDGRVRALDGHAGSSADQIAQAKALLDAGTIDQGEFDKLKAKALG